MKEELVSLLQWTENSSLAVAIRTSSWLYPALEIVHIVGIVLVVGAAVFFDLRLLGYFGGLPLKPLGHYLPDFSRRGLWLVIPSGILLFITNAASLGLDPVFWIKMLLLLCAALNAFIFHRFVWQGGEPRGGRFSAGFSIVVWIAVITFGRLLAY